MVPEGCKRGLVENCPMLCVWHAYTHVVHNPVKAAPPARQSRYEWMYIPLLERERMFEQDSNIVRKS